MGTNDSAKPIDVEGANFNELLAKSNLCVGPPVPNRVRNSKRTTFGEG